MGLGNSFIGVGEQCDIRKDSSPKGLEAFFFRGKFLDVLLERLLLVILENFHFRGTLEICTISLEVAVVSSKNQKGNKKTQTNMADSSELDLDARILLDSPA